MVTQLNEVKWSYLSLADARFLKCQIKEKLSVGEMRRISGWRWLSIGIRQLFRKPFSLLLSYTPYDLSDWLNVERSCGRTWLTEHESYSYSACSLFTSKNKNPVQFDLFSFKFCYSFQSCPQWLPAHVQMTRTYNDVAWNTDWKSVINIHPSNKSLLDIHWSPKVWDH